jgi:hypothetical protein
MINCAIKKAMKAVKTTLLDAIAAKATEEHKSGMTRKVWSISRPMIFGNHPI